MYNSQKIKFILLSILVGSIAACHKADEWDFDDYDLRLTAGNQTIFSEGVGAFSQAFPLLSAVRMAFHELGDLHFESTFVSAPAPKFPGLGTIYNNNSCFNCHINDGRGKPIIANEPTVSMLMRISIPGTGPHGGPNPVPGFGEQLQDKAVFGYQPEAKVSVSWFEKTVYFTDGDSLSLRYPQWQLNNAYIPLPAGMMMSARIAPPVHGLGLLEMISDENILALEDVQDKNNDGISGKANHTWDEQSKKIRLGRFGWKAEAPTLIQQVAGAYREDMGITSYVIPTENSTGQMQYDGLNDEKEVPDSVFDAVVFYVKTLAVPARRKVTDAEVKRGENIFRQAKCSSCHIPAFRTKTDVTFPEGSNLIIRPYTDLLLHDMGPDLSDNRPSYQAEGREWRTPPLWGIGLTKLVNGHSNFLHDGRARSLLEAVMWHGGEAENSKEYVRFLNKADRTALLAFLNSL